MEKVSEHNEEEDGSGDEVDIGSGDESEGSGDGVDSNDEWMAGSDSDDVEWQEIPLEVEDNFENESMLGPRICQLLHKIESANISLVSGFLEQILPQTSILLKVRKTLNMYEWPGNIF